MLNLFLSLDIYFHKVGSKIFLLWQIALRSTVIVLNWPMLYTCLKFPMPHTCNHSTWKQKDKGMFYCWLRYILVVNLWNSVTLMSLQTRILSDDVLSEMWFLLWQLSVNTQFSAYWYKGYNWLLQELFSILSLLSLLNLSMSHNRLFSLLA